MTMFMPRLLTKNRHPYELENKQVMEAVAAKILTLAGGPRAENVVQFSMTT
jgi:hypothetical protein